MAKLILNRDELDKILSAQGHAELCDESGRTWGYFVPVSDATPIDRLEIPISEEELRLAECEPGGRPLADILSELASRT